jgi:Dolichyl-phosphate-mannose-protein mannosyltransferase
LASLLRSFVRGFAALIPAAMRRPLHPPQLRSADFLLAYGVGCLLLALLTLVMCGLPDNPDAEVEFQTTRSLALGEGLAISDATPEGAGIIAAQFDVRQGRDGRYYSWFGVGQALVGVPFYWAGRALALLFPGVERLHRESPPHYGVQRSEYFEHLLVGWRNPVLCALIGWLMVLTARRLSASRLAAGSGALALVLCTYTGPQARASLSDVQASACLFAAFALLVAARDAYLRFERPRRAVLIYLGLCLGFAVLTRVAALPAVCVLFLATVLVTVSGRRRLWSSPLLRLRPGLFGASEDLFWVGLSAGACAALWLTTNQLRFGSPLETGYSAAIASGTFFAYSPWLGLAGLTIAPGKGLLWLAPALLAAPFGFWARGNDRLLWLTSLAISAAVFALVMPTQTFHGAWTFGPRYILPALPFLWLGTLLAWSTALRERGWRAWTMGGLFALGTVTNSAGVLVDQSTYHDLALQGARLAWPDVPGESEWERDNGRFVAIQWDWRFAAPWACWRILRHRVSHGDSAQAERFPASHIFFLDSPAILTPEHARDRGFRHLAWVDLGERLDGRPWPAIGVSLGLLLLGAVLCSVALNPTRP